MGEVYCWDGKDHSKVVKAEGLCITVMQQLTVCSCVTDGVVTLAIPLPLLSLNQQKDTFIYLNM